MRARRAIVRLTCRELSAALGFREDTIVRGVRQDFPTDRIEVLIEGPMLPIQEEGHEPLAVPLGVART